MEGCTSTLLWVRHNSGCVTKISFWFRSHTKHQIETDKCNLITISASGYRTVETEINLELLQVSSISFTAGVFLALPPYIFLYRWSKAHQIACWGQRYSNLSSMPYSLHPTLSLGTASIQICGTPPVRSLPKFGCKIESKAVKNAVWLQRDHAKAHCRTRDHR